MTEVTSYHNPNAPIERQWIAYVVLPSGSLWGVYATGTLQWQAEAKIKELWGKEQAKVLNRYYAPAQEAHNEAIKASQRFNFDPWATKDPVQQQRVGCMEDGPAMVNKQHHLAGLVWLIHKETREKKRVSPSDAEVMLISGNWERGGPRSK